MTNLERLTHLALLFVSLAAGTYLVRMHLFPSTQPALDRSAYASGKQFQGGERQNVDVFITLSSRCRFCAEQVPFYRRLLRDTQSHGPFYRVIFIANDSVSDVERMFGEGGPPPNVLAAESAPPGLPRGLTPTLVTVSRSGKVLFSHFGALPQARQDELVTLLSRMQ